MPIRLKFGNDLNIFGGSRGAGGFLSAPVNLGAGYPAYGNYQSTSNLVEYVNGSVVNTNGTNYLNQTCSVDVLADGGGGTFYDWANATNIAYKVYGVSITTFQTPIAGGPVEVPTSSGLFYNSGEWNTQDAVHDGYGYFAFLHSGSFTLTAVNTDIYGYSESVQNEVPDSSGHYWNVGLSNNYMYRWNGAGGYSSTYIDSSGTLHETGTIVDSNGSLDYNGADHSTEVPSGSMNYFPNGTYDKWSYYWLNQGGYLDYYTVDTGTDGGSFEAYGSYITSGIEGSMYTDFLWDGYGGYYVP